MEFPSHNIFDSGKHNDCLQKEKVGPDAMDTDNGVMQPPHPPSTPRPAPTPTFLVRDNDRDSDDSFRLGLEVVSIKLMLVFALSKCVANCF